MITCAKKKTKTSYPFSVLFFYIYIFVKFQNLAVLAGQYRSCNAKNSPFQAFRWWGAGFPSRPTIWTPGTGYAKNGFLFCCDVIEGDRFYSSNISFASSSGAWFFTQRRARNASNTRVTGDESQGTMGRRKKRSASFLLPAFVCSQILSREIDVEVWLWGRSLEVWAVLYKQYSRSPKRYRAHKIPFWGEMHFECIKGRLKKMAIVEHFPLSRCQSNAYEHGTRQMASFDDVSSLYPAQTNAR